MCFPARQRLSGFGLAKLTCYWLSQGSGESGKRDRGGGWGWRRGKGRGAARNSWGHACLAVSLALRASQAMVPDHWQPVTELNHVSGLCPGPPQFSWPSGSCRLNLSPADCELARAGSTIHWPYSLDQASTGLSVSGLYLYCLIHACLMYHQLHRKVFSFKRSPASHTILVYSLWTSIFVGRTNLFNIPPSSTICPPFFSESQLIFPQINF